VCRKRLKVMIAILLPPLEQHGRLKFGLADGDRVLAVDPKAWLADVPASIGDLSVKPTNPLIRKPPDLNATPS
jgi:hypothetical protein